MLVDIYKIGDPHGSYSVYLRFQTQLTVCFQCLEKNITLFTSRRNYFPEALCPKRQNSSCHKRQKGKFLLIFPEIFIFRSIAWEGNYLKLSQETMLRKRYTNNTGIMNVHYARMSFQYSALEVSFIYAKETQIKI